MRLPEECLHMLGITKYTDNNMFAHAEQTNKAMLNKKEEDFISDDMSYAVKTLERYYKGFLYSARDFAGFAIPYNEKKHKLITEYSHSLTQLRQLIVQNFPGVFPNMTTSQRESFINQLSKYSNYYKESSYDCFVPYEEFRDFLNLLQKERVCIMEFLQRENPFEIGEEREDDE